MKGEGGGGGKTEKTTLERDSFISVNIAFEDYVSSENINILPWYHMMSIMMKHHQPLLKSLNKLELLKK